MNSIFLSRLLRLILLLLFQVMVFNHIHLFGYITPLVIGYMVVCMHRNTSRTEILIWGFVIGLIFDMFSNTAGMAAGSCTLIAMIQPVLLNMLAPRDSADDLTPSFGFALAGLMSFSFEFLLLFVVAVFDKSALVAIVIFVIIVIAHFVCFLFIMGDFHQKFTSFVRS